MLHQWYRKLAPQQAK